MWFIGGPKAFGCLFWNSEETFEQLQGAENARADLATLVEAGASAPDIAAGKAKVDAFEDVPFYQFGLAFLDDDDLRATGRDDVCLVPLLKYGPYPGGDKTKARELGPSPLMFLLCKILKIDPGSCCFLYLVWILAHSAILDPDLYVGGTTTVAREACCYCCCCCSYTPCSATRERRASTALC